MTASGAVRSLPEAAEVVKPALLVGEAQAGRRRVRVASAALQVCLPPVVVEVSLAAVVVADADKPV